MHERQHEKIGCSSQQEIPQGRRHSSPLEIDYALDADYTRFRADSFWTGQPNGQRGVVQEVHDNLAAGIPRDANPFGGLVYRQILEMLDGVRDDAETRALIVRENRHYARRQLIWFRKEPRVIWLDGAGERDETFDVARALIEAHGVCR